MSGCTINFVPLTLTSSCTDKKYLFVQYIYNKKLLFHVMKLYLKGRPVKNQKRIFCKKSKNQTIIFYKTFLKPI